MSSDETQFGLKLTGVLRPKVKVEEKLRPSANEATAAGKLTQRIPDASGQTKTPDVAADIKPASPSLAALTRGPVDPEPAKPTEPVHPTDSDDLYSLSTAARGHRRRRKSGHSQMLYWLMGLGITAVIAGLVICWLYWQPLSALLVGGTVPTTPQKTVAIAEPNSKLSPAEAPQVAKPIDDSNPSVPGLHAEPAKAPAVATPAIKPAIAPLAKPVAQKPTPVVTKLDLDHPFFQRIKGPFPQLFKNSTGN